VIGDSDFRDPITINANSMQLANLPLRLVVHRCHESENGMGVVLTQL